MKQRVFERLADQHLLRTRIPRRIKTVCASFLKGRKITTIEGLVDQLYGPLPRHGSHRVVERRQVELQDPVYFLQIPVLCPVHWRWGKSPILKIADARQEMLKEQSIFAQPHTVQFLIRKKELIAVVNGQAVRPHFHELIFLKTQQLWAAPMSVGMELPISISESDVLNLNAFVLFTEVKSCLLVFKPLFGDNGLVRSEGDWPEFEPDDSRERIPMHLPFELPFDLNSSSIVQKTHHGSILPLLPADT